MNESLGVTSSSLSQQTIARRQRSLVDVTYEEVQKRIINGALGVGERIVIDALAREFGTSLIPIREALARLHAERLVSFEPNKGYRVAAPPDLSELAQLFDARLMLETGALRHSSPAGLSGAINELERINGLIANGRYGRSFDGYIEFVKLNAQFHLTIVKLCANPFILDAYDRLGYHQRILQTLNGRGVPDIDQIVIEHEAIIAALVSGSIEQACKALAVHILDAAERLDAAPRR